jgi:hypothetical protein
MTSRIIGSPTNKAERQVINVNGNYKTSPSDDTLNVLVASTVTLSDNPLFGEEHLITADGVAVTVIGGAHPLIGGPVVVAPNTAITVVFLISGSWVVTAGGGGGGTLLRNVVYVAKNGVDFGADGSISKPFLTVQAALQYAWTTYVLPAEPQPTPPFTRATVYVCPGTYDDGPLVLPPQICVMGMGGNISRITGNWTIDNRWSNYVPASLPSPPSVLVPSDMRSMFLLVGIYGNVTIDWNAHFSNEGKLWTQDCRFSAGTITITEKLANPSSNQWYSQDCEHNGDVILNGCNVQFTAPQFTTDPNSIGASLTLNQVGAAPDFNGTNYFASYGGTIGPITINATIAGPVPAYEARFGHAAQPGASFALNGTFSAAKFNEDALPQPSDVIFAGGATSAQISEINPEGIAHVTTTGLATGDAGYLSAANVMSKTNALALASSRAYGINVGGPGSPGFMQIQGVIAVAKFTTGGGAPAAGAPVYLALGSADAGTGAGKLTATAPTLVGQFVAEVGICQDPANYAGLKTAKILWQPKTVITL